MQTQTYIKYGLLNGLRLFAITKYVTRFTTVNIGIFVLLTFFLMSVDLTKFVLTIKRKPLYDSFDCLKKLTKLFEATPPPPLLPYPRHKSSCINGYPIDSIG